MYSEQNPHRYRKRDASRELYLDLEDPAPPVPENADRTYLGTELAQLHRAERQSFTGACEKIQVAQVDNVGVDDEICGVVEDELLRLGHEWSFSLEKPEYMVLEGEEVDGLTVSGTVQASFGVVPEQGEPRMITARAEVRGLIFSKWLQAETLEAEPLVLDLNTDEYLGYLFNPEEE